MMQGEKPSFEGSSAIAAFVDAYRRGQPRFGGLA
jgi:hypothetical protein